MRAKIIAVAIQSLVITLITVGLLEGLVAFSFRYPAASPLPFSLIRYLHVRFDRNIIQVMPECAIYDESISYTLKPGRCTFASREFNNEYRINSLGVRDDEASLAQPHTVMLGDSITMGWGVDQDDAFPSVFERQTGLLTLNAGIASYGTVRELKLLERVDRSALENIVVQYSDNDFVENEAYSRPATFATMSRAHYDKTVEDQRLARRYFPGKYAFNILVQMRAMLLGRPAAGVDQERPEGDVGRQAELFLHVVERSPVDLSRFGIVVFSLDPDFSEAAQRAAAGSQLAWVRNIQFLDLSRSLTMEGAFYTLDDHPTKVGHEAIARELVRALAKRN